MAFIASATTVYSPMPPALKMPPRLAPYSPAQPLQHQRKTNKTKNRLSRRRQRHALVAAGP
jgi:hypothetical protein